MSYWLEAIIAPADAFAEVQVEGSRPVDLAQGLSMLPLTSKLKQALGMDPDDFPLGTARIGMDADAYPVDAAKRLAPPVHDLCAAVSRNSRAIYVEAGMHGGPPLYQGFVAFEDGKQLGEPVVEKRFGPLIEGLRFLGAQKGTAYDEFAAVGLDRFRETNKWVSGAA